MPILEATALDVVSNNNTGEYAVVVWNNKTTKYEAVVGVFIISCGYPEDRARRYTRIIHEEGKAICFWGSKSRCEEVVVDFKKIGVIAEIINNN